MLYYSVHTVLCYTIYSPLLYVMTGQGRMPDTTCPTPSFEPSNPATPAIPGTKSRDGITTQHLSHSSASSLRGPLFDREGVSYVISRSSQLALAYVHRISKLLVSVPDGTE